MEGARPPLLDPSLRIFSLSSTKVCFPLHSSKFPHLDLVTNFVLPSFCRAFMYPCRSLHSLLSFSCIAFVLAFSRLYALVLPLHLRVVFLADLFVSVSVHSLLCIPPPLSLVYSLFWLLLLSSLSGIPLKRWHPLHFIALCPALILILSPFVSSLSFSRSCVWHFLPFLRFRILASSLTCLLFSSFLLTLPLSFFCSLSLFLFLWSLLPQINKFSNFYPLTFPFCNSCKICVPQIAGLRKTPT